MKSKQIYKCINPVLFITGLLVISSCAGSGVNIRQLATDNYNDRVRYLVIHHTVVDFQQSVDIFTRPDGASSHYLIPEGDDESYPSDNLEVIQLVHENDRAWHAGVSYWQGKSGLNDQSIGIELVSRPSCDDSLEPLEFSSGLNANAMKEKICFYPDYDDQQIKLLIKLIKGILKRHPEITDTRIIGHSDITPDRKIDPGPRFPWHRLYKAGIGAWYDNESVVNYWRQLQIEPASIGVVQAALKAYGYGIIETGTLDTPTINALTAFQMHFRPWEVDGKSTAATVATLFALLERYFPDQLEQLLTRVGSEKLLVTDYKDISDQGQFNGLLPVEEPSTRKLVNNKKIFKAYKGTGTLKVTSKGATSADIFINDDKVGSTVGLIPEQEVTINIKQQTRDGFNTLKIENIAPEGSHILLNIPYPRLGKAKPESVGFSSKRLKKIDQLINEEVANGFPGATLLIAKNGKIIKHSSYGFSNRYDANGIELSKPQKMQKDTLFDMASNTKMYVTNYALMKLATEKRLDFKAPISRYIPEYQGHGRDGRTVKDLLTHSAGYAPSIHFYDKENDYGEHLYSQNKQHTQYLLTQKVPFDFGRNIKARYSDTDYMLLGTLIERITEMPLDEYVENEIYKPLGLKQTVFTPLQKGFEKKQIAATELKGNTRGGQITFDNIRENVIHGEVHDEKAFYSMEGVAGHAGLFSTAEDTAVLASVMLNRGGYGELGLFDKGIIDQFTKPSDLNTTIGLGWRRASNGELIWQYGPYASPYAYGHTGWTGTVTIIDPFYDLIIVLLTNKKHSPMVEAQDDQDDQDDDEVHYEFSGDDFETGKYGSIVTLVYEAFLFDD